MADPEANHGFVYTNAGITDIDTSPFFDVHPGIDFTVDGHIQRVKFTLSGAIEEHLGIYRCLSKDYADTPLHSSYAALQTLYRADRASESAPTVDPVEPPSLLFGNLTEGVTESAQPLIIDVMRFRPNLVISGAEAYVEDTWTAVCIGKAQFSSLGGCNRCQMINIDQESGEAQNSKEPLATLASYRRVKGKILFGVLLRYENAILGGAENCSEHWLEVGQKIYPSIQLI